MGAVRRHRVASVLQVDDLAAFDTIASDAVPHQLLGAMLSEAIVLGDAEIRESLLSNLRQRHEGEADVAFMEELGLCRGEVRVDVAVVNGTLHGYEIKSDRDSLRRLSNQVLLYGRVLDRATLVVGERHASEAMQAVPAWWEVQLVRVSAAGIRLKRLRRGSKNPDRDPRALVELLWLEEALSLLAARDSRRGYSRKPRVAVWDRICELFNVDEIASEVRARLKARSASRSAPPPP